MRIFIFFLVIISFAISCFAANPYFLNKKGIKKYDKRKYSSALKYFKKAYNLDKKEEFKFNQGVSLYKLKEYKKAEDIFQSLLNSSLKEKAYYNLGVIKYKQKKLKQALNFFKKAIKLNPDDLEARINYELILKQLQKKNPNSNKKKNKNKQEKKKKQNKDKRQKHNKQQQKQQKEHKEKRNKVIDKKILNLYNDDKELLKKSIKRQFHFKYKKPEKDW